MSSVFSDHRASRSATHASPSWLKPVLGWSITALTCMALWSMESMSHNARISLMVFVLAIAAWALTHISETVVALCAAASLPLLGTLPAQTLFSSLGNELIWLLIGSFLMAAVIRSNGVAERVVVNACRGCSTPRSLFYRLTLLIGATAFIIPSTSARAALLLPVFAICAERLPHASLVRALALLFPSIILLSACASLLGAGAHLVAVNYLRELGMNNLSFVQWAMLGTPFALMTCFFATELILRLFVPSQWAAKSIQPNAAVHGSTNATQWRVAIITVLIIAMWASSALHGVDPAIIALFGALLLAQKQISGVSFNDAVKNVEWGLILFLAATLVLGQALLDSGAAASLARLSFAMLPAAWLEHHAWVVVITCVIAMLSHLLITSRSARAAVLIPAVALPLAIMPEQAPMLILIVVFASGYCQTLRVSAKPVALYQRHNEQPTYRESDLLRLSLYLMPPFAISLIVFALYIWPLLDRFVSL